MEKKNWLVKWTLEDQSGEIQVQAQNERRARAEAAFQLGAFGKASVRPIVTTSDIYNIRYEISEVL